MQTDKAQQEPTTTRNGVCVRCRRSLPASSFKLDAAGQPTAWCTPCRDLHADKWGVDGDLVEFLYALHVNEQALKKEVRVVLENQVAMGHEPASALEILQTRIHDHDRIRHTRLPRRMHEILDDIRDRYYEAVGVPVLAFPEPDKVAT